MVNYKILKNKIVKRQKCFFEIQVFRNGERVSVNLTSKP